MPETLDSYGRFSLGDVVRPIVGKFVGRSCRVTNISVTGHLSGWFTVSVVDDIFEPSLYFTGEELEPVHDDSI